MRVFVTGATGFVGTAVVRELIAAGHQVIGLARSEISVQKLETEGASYLRGDIEDLKILREGASKSDAVIHLAFIADFANFAECCAKDRAAIKAMGDMLAATGGSRALIITSGTMMLKQGKLNDESAPVDSTSLLAAARGASEQVCLDYVKSGLRAIVVRLPPSTHGPGWSGFAGQYVSIALNKGVAPYIGTGDNMWCAVHRDDAAKVYQLALEKAEPGSILHAVAEQGVPLKSIAGEVGKQLELPIVSVESSKKADYFGWFAIPMTADNLATSNKTKEQLSWKPTKPGLLEDIPNIVRHVRSHTKE